jgi:hypothetical protein
MANPEINPMLDRIGFKPDSKEAKKRSSGEMLRKRKGRAASARP